QHRAQCENIPGVVVDEQNRCAGEARSIAQHPNGTFKALVFTLPFFKHRHLCTATSCRQRQGEGAAFARRTDDLDGTAEQSRDLEADSQSQSGSTVSTTDSAIRLLKGLEDEFLLVRGYSYSAVLNHETYHRLAALYQRRPNGHKYATGGGELESIRE